MTPQRRTATSPPRWTTASPRSGPSRRPAAAGRDQGTDDGGDGSRARRTALADDRAALAQGLDRARTVDGMQVEGTWRSHQVPLSEVRTNAGHLEQLEEWLRVVPARTNCSTPTAGSGRDVATNAPAGTSG